MTIPNFTEIPINPSKFGFASDEKFISEAWDISQRGDFVVGTVVRAVTAQLLAGEFWGFAGPIALGFQEGKLQCKSDSLEKVDGPLGAAATSAQGCNDLGDVVGFYRNAQDNVQGFVRLAGRAAEEFALPARDRMGTRLDMVRNGVLGINNQRVVVGVYKATNATREVGFVAHVNNPNKFTEIDLGANDATVDSTRINAISSDGKIVGSYRQNGSIKPFRWQVGLTHPFDPIGAVQKDFPQGISTAAEITAFGINDRGHIVGFSNPTIDPNARVEGFLWHPEPNPSVALTLREHFNFSVETQDKPATATMPAMPATTAKTLAGGVSFHGIVVGARRVNLPLMNPADPNEKLEIRRRAYVCIFLSDVQRVLEQPGWNVLTGPFPGVPLPLPNPFWPVWNAFYGGRQDKPNEGHNAMVGLLMNELISSMTEGESRRRLRAEVLDMVIKEIGKLIDKKY